jgi:hypothetical protein
MIFQVRKTATPNDDFIRVQNKKIYFDPAKEPEKEAEGIAFLSSICKFETGKLDVSKVKDKENNMSAERKEGFIPLIYNENIVGGELVSEVKLTRGRKQFIREDYSKKSLVQAPFIIVGRTVGKKNELRAALVEGDKFCYIENHVPFGKSASIEDLRKAYQIITNKDYIKTFLDKTFGQVKTITNTFMNDLPIPKEETEKPKKRKLRLGKEDE